MSAEAVPEAVSAPRVPRIAVVGFPNVGKSTLINRLAGGREAVEHDRPGATRDRKELSCDWNGVEFKLVDTGGVDLEAGDRVSREVQTQAREAIATSDAVMLVLDARAGLRAGDAEIARLLQRGELPVIVVANKVDSDAQEPLAAELAAAGLGMPIPVSAAQGRGTGDLLDELARVARERGAGEPRPDAETVAVCVIGRPNVGKSSLVNAFLGEPRVIVTELAGTTRDAIDTELSVGERRLTLIDTAGLRKRSRIAGTVEQYAQIRSERAAGRSDVAIVVLDAREGVRSEDLRVAELAMRSGCATLVALNKWDETQTDLEDAKARLARRLRLRPPVVTCSALKGRNVHKLLPAALELADRRAERIPTPLLNRVLSEAVARHQPPMRRGRRLKLYYAAQVERRPPRISVHVNDRKLVDRDWAFYLENRLREAGGWDGVPLIIDFVPRDGRSRGGGAGGPG